MTRLEEIESRTSLSNCGKFRLMLAEDYTNVMESLDEAAVHIRGLVRYAEAVRHSAGMGKNQAERLEGARAFLASLEGK